MKEVVVTAVEDFAITGDGSAPAWSQIDWIDLQARADRPSPYRSRFKVAYSDNALYVLFDCEDKYLTCTDLKDFEDLFDQDVVEFFLWPDESQRVYFEYEASPLGAELPICVVNNGEEFMGWRPWHYAGERRCSVKTHISGGPREAGAAVDGWFAEVRMPFALLKGLGNCVPKSGMHWRANFYRIDYDLDKAVHFMWSPVRIKEVGFHDIDSFGRLVFA